MSGSRRWTLTPVSLWSIHTQTCTFQGWTYGFSLFSQLACWSARRHASKSVTASRRPNTPRPWATLGGSINILQQSNAAAQTRFVGHKQSYGLTAWLAPRECFGTDRAYNFNGVIQKLR